MKQSSAKTMFSPVKTPSPRIAPPSRGPGRGLAVAPPLAGRQDVIAALARGSQSARLLVLRGEEGVGKSRLGAELLADPDPLGVARVARVRVEPEDRFSAVAARAERALGVCPGGLGEALSSQSLALILDDAHLLGEEAGEAGRLVAGRGPGRVVALTAESWPGSGRAVARADLSLEGVDEEAAAAIWSHFDALAGPAGEEAFERAVARARGYPLALAREHARAVFGEEAWNLDVLPWREQRALSVLAVMRRPVSPVAVEAVAPEIGDAEGVLGELLRRHLVAAHLVASPTGRGAAPDGRLLVPGGIRARALARLGPEERAELERGAAEAVAAAGAGAPEAAAAGEAIDELRDLVRHYTSAGDAGQAAEILAEGWERAARRGGAAEVEALICEVEARGGEAPELAGARARVAAREGRFAEAAEISARAPDADPVETARLEIRLGEIDAGAEKLADLASDPEPETRARAAAALAELALARGAPERARQIAGDAFARDRGAITPAARADLHRVLGAVETREGRFASARANLSRGAGAARGDPRRAARIELERARCLAAEGRLSEAAAAAAEGERSAAELGDVPLIREAGVEAALRAARRGDRAEAERGLNAQLRAMRALGDELGALEVEVAIAEIALARGDLVAARERARAAAAASAPLGLEPISARAELVLAGADAEAFPEGADARAISAIAERAPGDPWIRRHAERCAAAAEAAAGRADRAGAGEDEVSAALARTSAALAAGAADEAEEGAKQALLAAERLRCGDEAAEAIAILARLSLARGERERAASRAHRALTRARERGLPRAQATALLVDCALAREAGDLSHAERRAGDAASVARAAGLPALEAAAGRAAEILAGSRGEEGAATERAAAELERELGGAASPYAELLLADLGLTPDRPYRLVLASGESRRIAEAGADRLRAEGRDLVIDAVGHAIWRRGERVADLGRRTLLRRLLYLFSANPGRAFSKEEIVEAIWGVEYHPLRHDAALFTSMMRLRRLLGDDGAAILRACDSGYICAPPEDFAHVEAAPR